MRNYFISEGNIGSDPLLKTISSNGEDKKVLEMNVRFPYERLNKKTGEYEDQGGFWTRVAMWGKRAEICYSLLKKGMRVIVVGEQSQHTFVLEQGERAGETVTATDVIAFHMGLVLTSSVTSIGFVKRSQDVTASEYEQYETSVAEETFEDDPVE